jgi:metallophosphoesterase (TIGR00282 family)
VRILYCGDVVGRAGRKAIGEHLPVLREKLKLDAVIVCGENAAGGFGVTRDICEEFVKKGADAVTGGDHVFDQEEVWSFIGNYPQLVRPANYPEGTPGKGTYVFETKSGKPVLLIHLLAQVFMKTQLDNPFAAVDGILAHYRLGGNVSAIVVDFHGEATSEKMAMGHYLDGRVSLVVGSHTHVPTADGMLLPKRTAYQTDAGMCGAYHSVIGFDPKAPLEGFTKKYRTERMTPANGEPTLCGVFVETDDKTGLAIRTQAVRIGGVLAASLPEVA